MKLILLTLCVVAMTYADVRWDPSGQYRIIVTEPLEDVEAETKTLVDNIKELKMDSEPFIKKYRIVDLDSDKADDSLLSYKTSYPYRGVHFVPYRGVHFVPYRGVHFVPYRSGESEYTVSSPYAVRYLPFHYDYKVTE